METTKQCLISEPCKPGSRTIVETVKAKLPVFALPLCIILIVYFIDNALSWITSVDKQREGDFEVSSILFIH